MAVQKANHSASNTKCKDKYIRHYISGKNDFIIRHKNKVIFGYLECKKIVPTTQRKKIRILKSISRHIWIAIYNKKNHLMLVKESHIA